MKFFFMGSAPTFRRSEQRELSAQEKLFADACLGLGRIAAERGHTVLVADEHPASVDYNVVQGVIAYVNGGPDRSAHIQINRPEGAELVFENLPDQITVERLFHAELDRSPRGIGTLIPNMAALEACDALVMIGGKDTARIVGLLAANQDRRLLAIPAFGGAAEEIYDRLKHYYKHTLTNSYQALSALRSAWTETSAEGTVGIAEDLVNREKVNAPESYFISYTWAESHAADHIEVLLRRFGRAVNRDEPLFDAGSDLSDVVKSMISESDTFVGLWSQRFKDSTWCPHELEYARNRQSNGEKPRRVILIALDETEVPIRFTGNLRLAGAERRDRELSIRKLMEEES